ncbi:MAG: hypothetical protein CMA12_03575 [Euryarchaeota archaeon]|nr:hypothetical protein [Euryarchaeota archaeon]OUW22567.1 MAG: hypothetical protein CBD33_01920 [Euryarchaeota archaeon TMED173]
MGLTRTRRLSIVFGASFAVFILMMISVNPEIQYSVDEIMSDPTDFENQDIFVRGVVSDGTLDSDEMVFVLEGIDFNIIVDFSETPIPDGFDEGKTIAVRGLFQLIEGNWSIDSQEIQTGCPSKYES